MTEITIREAIKSDIPEIFKLIKELAEYENGLHHVSNNEEQMLLDGFGDNPIFWTLVAEKNHKIIGISIYYIRYSTWKGKRLYLEDILVTNSERGKGIGKLLMDKTIEKAKELNCTGVMWQVLEWNKPAINFYNKYNASYDNEWVNVSIELK